MHWVLQFFRTVLFSGCTLCTTCKNNFAVKHLQLQQLWDACPEADMNNILERIDLEDSDRFDHTFAKKAFNQITNGYKQLLDAMAKSGCRKQNRYQALVSLDLPFENFRNLSS